MGSHFLCATLYIHVCMKITYIHVRLYVCVQTYIHNIHVGHNVHSSIHTHNFYRLLIRIHIYPSSHCSAAPLGVQCLHTSSRGEFPGYWDWLWCPGLPSVLVCIAFPFVFPYIGVFPFTLLHLPLNFVRVSFL